MNILPQEFKNAINLEYGKAKMSSRILFVVILILDLLVSFNPYSNSDFTPLLNYFYNEPLDYTAPATIPLSSGNVIYLVTTLAFELVCAMAVGIFSGVQASKYDVARSMVGEAGVGKVTVGKCIIWILFVLLFSVPFMISFVYMLIPTIFIMPAVIMLPSVYLNGNTNIFKSIGRCVWLMRRAYLKTMHVIVLIYLSYYIINLISNLLIYQLSSPAAIVISGFAEAWCWTALGRFAAQRYGFLRLMKGANPLGTSNQDH